MSLMPEPARELRIVLPGIHVVEISPEMLPSQPLTPVRHQRKVIVRHHHAADLLIPLRLVLFNPAQERGRMPRPQRLASMRIELFGYTVLLPALHDLQRTAIGGEYGVTQGAIRLFIEQKQPLALG